MLIVVRPAEAGSKGSWAGPDLHRPLSPEGHDQADGLVVRLDDYPVERILSSPAARCLQTVEPLARDRLLQVEEAAALGVDADTARVESRFVHPEAANAVLCTHGELWRTDRRLHARFVAPLALDRRSYAG